MKLRTVIVDDEAFARASLLEDLQLHCPEVVVVGQADSVREAVQVITQEQPQLVFLDIQLGDGTGFEVLERLGAQPDCAFVFVTAYDQFAIKAFRYAATDYLLKPINATELKAAVQKVAQNSVSSPESIKLLLSTLARRSTPDRIVIPTAEGIHVLHAREIVRCQSDSNYTRIHLESGEKIMAAKTLKDLEEILSDSNFERVHTSHLVNLQHLKKYLTRDGGILILSDNSEVPVSQRKRAQLLEVIRNIK